ncbi:MAG: AMP-binding protein, partial [Chloroflexota bacterium]
MSDSQLSPVRPTQPVDFVPLSPDLVEKSIPALFELNAAKRPDSVAVTSRGVALTYRELDRRSNALANRIVAEAGEGKEPVAILCGHTSQAIVSILGTLKSGRPYIGLDASFPLERMKQIVSDSGTRYVLTDEANLETGRDLAQAGVALMNIEAADLGLAEGGPGIFAKPTDLAVIFYTSGSTGNPKGVVWKHETFVSNSIHQVNQVYTSPSDRCLLINSIAYASSRTSVYDTLLSGGTVCMYDIKAKGAAAMADFLLSERVTILRCPTPVLRTIFGPLPDGFIFPDMRLGLMGGQAPTAQDVMLYRRHTPPDSVFGNHFASTEVGIISNYLLNRETPMDWDILPVASLVL